MFDAPIRPGDHVIWLLWTLAQAAPAAHCDAASWRLAVANAAVETRADDASLPRLSAMWTRGLAPCKAAEAAPACAGGLVEPLAKIAAQRDQLAVRVDALQSHETTTTLLTRVAEARHTLALLGPAVANITAFATNEISAERSAVRSQAESALQAAVDALEARVAAEGAMRAAERALVEGVAAFDAARCDDRCDEPTCSPRKRDGKTLETLRKLYVDLIAADESFVERYSEDVLTERITTAGAGGESAEVARARAALLRSHLASTSARPAHPREALGRWLATLGAPTRLATAHDRQAVAWLGFEREYRKLMERLDGRIDAAIAAWVAIDDAASQDGAAAANARSRFQIAIEGIRKSGASYPR